MRRPPTTFWILSLVFFISGCTSYRHAILPGQQGIPENDGGPLVVETKANARVTLKTGHVCSGQVLRCSEEELVLGKIGNFGMEETPLRAGEIETIEVEYSSSRDKAIIYPLIGLAAAGIAVFVVFANGLEDGLSGLN